MQHAARRFMWLQQLQQTCCFGAIAAVAAAYLATDSPSLASLYGLQACGSSLTADTDMLDSCHNAFKSCIHMALWQSHVRGC